MDVKPMRSIGKMETWEPPDKSFSKHTITEGQGDVTPNEGSVCQLTMNLVGRYASNSSEIIVLSI